MSTGTVAAAVPTLVMSLGEIEFEQLERRPAVRANEEARARRRVSGVVRTFMSFSLMRRR
jgi:hypothetical protein